MVGGLTLLAHPSLKDTQDTPQSHQQIDNIIHTILYKLTHLFIFVMHILQISNQFHFFTNIWVFLHSQCKDVKILPVAFIVEISIFLDRMKRDGPESCPSLCNPASTIALFRATLFQGRGLIRGGNALISVNAFVSLPPCVCCHCRPRPLLPHCLLSHLPHTMCLLPSPPTTVCRRLYLYLRCCHLWWLKTCTSI